LIKAEIHLLMEKMSKYSLIIGALVCSALILIALCSGEDFNGTVYRLSLSNVEVTEPVNSECLNLTLQQKAENFTLLDSSGQSVPINISETFWGGDHKYALRFDRPVLGKLIYNYRNPSPQQLVIPLQGKGPVRVVLPPGYTTGDRILGIASPTPDEVLVSEDGRSLTWYNTSQHLMLEVNYYQEKAPTVLKKVFLALLVIGAAILLEYYLSIRRLRAVRDDVEKQTKIN